LGDDNLLHRLPDFHQLSRAGGGVRLQLAALRPAIGVVVVSHVADQQIPGRLVHDQTQVTAHPHGGKVRVLGTDQHVEAETGTGRIHLQIKDSGLDQLLLGIGQLNQAINKGISDSKFHKPSI
jgi:hypothetical protein